MNDKYGTAGRMIIVSTPFVAMVVYSFNTEKYIPKEVSQYEEETCAALAKHDPKNVRCYKFDDKKYDNIAQVMNKEGGFVYTRVFERY